MLPDVVQVSRGDRACDLDTGAGGDRLVVNDIFHFLDVDSRSSEDLEN